MFDLLNITLKNDTKSNLTFNDPQYGWKEASTFKFWV